MSRLIDAVKLMQDFTMRQGEIPYNVFYGVIKDTVDKQVTAKQESGWILCSERLPTIPEQKINEGYHRIEVIAAIKDSEVPVQLVWFDIENNEFYDDWDWFASKFNKTDILAWQPLPQPYKEADSK